MPAAEFLEQVRAASADPAAALRLTLGRLQADTGTIHRLGADGMLHLEAWAGGIPDELLPVIRTIPVGKGIAGLAVERRAPVDLCNLQTDASGAARPRARETGVKGSICVPMLAGEEPVGALGVATARERVFTEEETRELLEIGRILADAGP
jgi:L-methionine (R)-S-oxide reductase